MNLLKNIPLNKSQIVAALVIGLILFLVLGLVRGTPVADFTGLIASVWGLVLAVGVLLKALFGVLAYVLLYLILAALTYSCIAICSAKNNKSDLAR